MTWIIVIAGLLVAGAAALWWLLIKTEGIYLGRGAVIWLYDLYAHRYDHIKQFDPTIEDVYLARPVLQRLAHVRAPLVLDVATGTGRMPLALFEQPAFQGRIIALDLSRRMIALAAHKLAPYRTRVSLLHYPAEVLPFTDDIFDLVTCMEALEFMMDPGAVLRELVRVLRPGGLLVMTNRQGLDARLMPGRTWAHGDLKDLLCSDLGMVRVEIEIWQMDYRLVWAAKPGVLVPAGPLGLAEVWRCPRCGALRMVPVDEGWRCDACGGQVPVGADGVIEAAGVPVE
jgi:SAM-dependent methyltransferase